MRRPITLAPSALPIAFLATLVLTLGACSGGDDEPAPDAPATATAGPTDGADDPDGDAETDAGDDAGDSTEPGDGDGDASGAAGASCIEGTWTADNAATAAATTSAPGMSDLGATAAVTGSSTVTFSGSDLIVEYDAQTTEVTWSMQGQDVRMVMTFDGTLTGTVDVTDDTVTFQGVDDTALSIDYTTWVGGQELAVPGADGMISSGFEAGGSSRYTCSGDRLELTPVVEGVDTSGMVTVLRR